jgi:hypothetical protein
MLIRNTLAVMLFALSGVGAAVAADAPPKQEGPCAADFKKFCPGMQPGRGRIYRCMMSHEAELTPACRDVIKAANEKIERMAKACKADLEKYCKGIPPGDGRILSCLKGRESDLSKTCAAELKPAKG